MAMIRTLYLAIAVSLALPAWAASGMSCAGLDAPGKHYIYIADASFKRVRTESLELGTVELPQKRKIDYFVVVSPDFTVDIQAGGRDVEGELHPSGMSCKRAKVYRLSFHFGSVLPPGAFSIPFPVLALKSDGRPAITASPQILAGIVSRVWIKSNVSDEDKIVLRNEGNRPASKLSFVEPEPSSLRIKDNHCEGASLKAGDSCEILLETEREGADVRAGWKADYADSNEYLDMSISVEHHRVSVLTFNKFYD